MTEEQREADARLCEALDAAVLDAIERSGGMAPSMLLREIDNDHNGADLIKVIQRALSRGQIAFGDGGNLQIAPSPVKAKVDENAALKAQTDALAEALGEIAERDWTENCLDPQWAVHRARSALAGYAVWLIRWGSEPAGGPWGGDGG